MGFENVEFNLWYADTLTPGYIAGLSKRCTELGLRAISLQGTGIGGDGSSGVIKDVAHELWLMHYVRLLGGRVVKFTGAKRGTQGGLDAIIEVCKWRHEGRSRGFCGDKSVV